jgi:hypothetical protein
MAVLVSKANCNLSDANAFYVSENNAFGFDTGTNSLASALTQALTFSSACNFYGVAICVMPSRADIGSRTVTVKLQENVASVWTDRLTMTKTMDDITGGQFKTFTTDVYRGSFLIPFDWESVGGYPVTTGAGVWRLEISQGGTGGNLNIARISTSYSFSYVAWTDVTATFNNDDSILCKDIVKIDQNATFGGILPAGWTTRAHSIAICSNVSGVAKPEDLAYLRWVDNPAGSYTMTLKGHIYFPCFSAFNIGSKDVTINDVSISIASPAVITKTAHGLIDGDRIKFATTGALPTGLTAGTTYYVVNKTADTFEVEASVGGGSINTSGTQSGTHTCTNIRSIPFSSKAILEISSSYVGTTYPSMFYTPATGLPSYGSLFFYGETESAYRYTTLKANAAGGQPIITTNDNVDWVAGDIIHIGKQNIGGAGEFVAYTISTVVGDTITLTGNITSGASLERVAGGTVFKINNYSILIQNPPGNSSVYSINGFLNLVFDKVETFNISLTATNVGTTLGGQAVLLDKYKKQVSFTNCLMRSDNTNSTYFFQAALTEKGILCQDCIGYRTFLMASIVAAKVAGFAFVSGRLVLKDCRMINLHSFRPIGSNQVEATLDSNIFENPRGASTGMNYRGSKLISTNNYVWGAGANLANSGAISVEALINPILIKNNKVEKCSCGIAYTPNSVTTDVVDKNMEFKDCTLDIGISTGAFPKYTFADIILSSALTITNPESVMTDGGIIAFTNYDSTTSYDFSLHSKGGIDRTKDSNPDTTVRTVGGSAMRFSPYLIGDSFEYTFEIPTGNIQNKVMTLSTWVKIASANFYAGDKTMPFLSVAYDDGDNVQVSTATETTEWQLLSVTFTPTTTSGRVAVTLGGVGSVVGANGYFYYDDFSTFYPLDSNVDFGTFDIWSRGMPVFPPIKTAMSPSDVWAVNPATFTTGSVGERLNRIKKDTGLIPGLY